MREQVHLEMFQSTRRFGQVAFDVQAITPRMTNGFLKFLAIADIFSRCVREKAIPDERGKNFARTLVEERTSVFDHKTIFLSDEELNLAGDMVKNLTVIPVNGRIQNSALHSETKEQ